MDVPHINAEAIETMIEKFRSLGEQNWQSNIPVERSNLPKDTFSVLAEPLRIK
jgi:hypothetical protein